MFAATRFHGGSAQKFLRLNCGGNRVLLCHDIEMQEPWAMLRVLVLSGFGCPKTQVGLLLVPAVYGGTSVLIVNSRQSWLG